MTLEWLTLSSLPRVLPRDDATLTFVNTSLVTDNVGKPKYYDVQIGCSVSPLFCPNIKRHKLYI